VTIYTPEGEMHQQLITEEVMLLDGARLTTFVEPVYQTIQSAG